MWFIKYTDNQDNYNYVKEIFERKADAFTYIKTNLNNDINNVEILNINTSLISDDISLNTKLFLKSNKNKPYGTICDLTNHLVCVNKGDDYVVELTKARINRELILGNIYISA
ncbi:hypothetical protein ACSW8S_17130 (plasmid) [Clostridium perfringens]